MKSSTLTFLKTLLLGTALLIGLVGCATMEGAGKDIESAGEAVQDAAN
jgi:predicted small secreted protein